MSRISSQQNNRRTSDSDGISKSFGYRHRFHRENLLKKTNLVMDEWSEELLFSVFVFVPPQDLLCRVGVVCKRWSAVLSSSQFWHNHPLLPQHDKNGHNKDNECQQGDLELNMHQIQRICLYKATVSAIAGCQADLPNAKNSGSHNADSSSTGLKLPPMVRPQSVFPTAKEAAYLEYGAVCDFFHRRCCVASTTDHFGEELRNVLPVHEDQNSTPDILDGFVTQHLADADPRSALSALSRLPGALGLFGRFRRREHKNWWSSKPSPRQDSKETLLFATRHPLVLLTSLRIKPLADPINRNLCYTWRQTTIRAYRLPIQQLLLTQRPGHGAALNLREFHSTGGSNADEQQQSPPSKEKASYISALSPSFPCSFPISSPTANDNHGDVFPSRMGLSRARPDQATIDATLEGLRPVFESEPFVLPPNSDNPYEFKFPVIGAGVGVLANVIEIELVGKNHEQFPGHGYYACVESVDSIGIPLLEHPF